MTEGLLLSIAGSALMAAGDGGLASLAITNPEALLGDLLALGCAIMDSAYPMVGSRMRTFTPTFIYSTLVYGFSALYLVAACLAAGLPFSGYRPASYMYLIALAVIPQIIGHTSINWALKHVRASMVSITILGEPVGSALLAWLFFSETIGTLQGAGIAAIFAAIILGSRTARRDTE